MNCPQCGELCRCQLEPLLPVSSQWETDVVFDSSSVAALETACDPEVRQSSSADQVEAESPATNGDSTDAPAWRDELSARLNRYRARRKAPPPRYPSLRLQFEMPALPTRASTPPMAAFESVSNHALALDGMRHVPSAALETDVQSQHESETEPAREPVRQRPASAGAKIIEFPGFSWGPPAAPPDQLAEPVVPGE